MNAEYLIKKMMNFYNVLTIKELADKIGISQQAISKWKNNNSEIAIKKRCRELGIYDKIFIDLNTMESTNKDEIEDLFESAYQEAKDLNNIEDLKKSLSDFRILNQIKTKFNVMYKEQNFYEYILHGYADRIANILLLAKVLHNSNITPSLENAKSQLIELINQYELKLIEDRVIHLLKNQSKETLKKWIKEELDNIQAYSILTNIPNVMDFLEENINLLNKPAINKLKK